MPEPVFSHCRGCLSSCGLIFEVENDRIVSHRADPDSLVSAGFKCVKGDMSVAYLQGGEGRFLECQRRDDSGELTPIAPDLLMDEVAAVVASSIERHGPRSVALYLGTAGYRKSFNVSLARQLMGAIGSPQVYSTMTIDQSAHWVVEGRMGVFATRRPFFEDVDVIVVSGANPVISHSSSHLAVPIVNQVPKMRAFRARGGKLIVVDPRRTETARLADLHIQSRPGTDTEIFACLNHIILANDWQDPDFCTRYVGALEALRAAVAPYTPAFVAARAGVTAEELVEAARIIGSASRLSAGFGTGTAMSPHPNTAGHMVEALNALRGGFARAGDLVRNPGIFVKRATVERVIPPKRTWDKEPKLRTGYGTLYGEFPTSRLVDEILTPGPEQIRTLIVLGANPMMAFGEPERLRQALRTLDCLIVIEPRATETTAFADYVVAPPLQYEVHDFNLANSSRMEAPIVQYTEPVVEPPPGVLNEWEFFNGVANRLGFTLRATPGSFAFNPAKANAAKAIDPQETWTTKRLIEATFADVGLSLDEVRRHPHGLEVPYPPQTITAPETDDGARLDVCPPDVAAELAEIFAAEPRSIQDYMLVPRRIIELMNSEFRFAETTQRRFDGAAPLYMHPDDMSEEGFETGERIRITGDHGQISACVRADASLRRGVVAMTHCWSGDADGDPSQGHTSNLVSMRVEHVQKIDGMPLQSSLPVKLGKAAPPEQIRDRIADAPAH